MTAYVISIANEKGGVAKTTTTLSLGGAMAEIGKKVLLIDLDPQGNLSLSLGFDDFLNQQSIFSVGLRTDQLTQATSIENLHMIPAASDLREDFQSADSRPDNFTTIKSIIPSLMVNFDYILMDCPPYLGFIVEMALNSSNLVIIPTQSEYYSICALQNMMSYINRIRNNGNSRLCYRLLITMFDKRNSIHCSLANYLRATFTTGLFDTAIEIDTKLRESPLRGFPIIKHAAHSRASMQYRFLAQEIENYVKKSV